jgi:circadian clock protein KaiC
MSLLETRLKTGVSGLDEVLHGGVIAGRLYLIDGNPGAGKTTLAIQFLLEGARLGERCLYVTLSETKNELAAGAASHGWSLDDIEICELIVSDLSVDGEDDLTMYHPSEVELSATTRKALNAVEQFKPQRIVFDSLSELRLLAQSSLRYRRQVLAIKQFFVDRGCTVFMLDDRTAEGPDLQLQSIAHGVISLEHSVPTYGRALRQLCVVKFRGSDFRSGRHDFDIGRDGLEVYPRLSAVAHRAEFVREVVASDIKALDALLGGGIDRGTSTLLVGPPGSGKSTMALQYASAAARRGSHAAIFAFEEAPAILLERAASLGFGIQEGSGPGQIAVRQIDPADIAPGQFAALVRRAVERDGAQVVVIDSLNGYLNAMPEDRFLTAQLHELLSYLGNQGVATFLVAAQSGVMGPAMRSHVDASYLADTIVIFRMFEHRGSVKKAVSILKKRSGPHEETIREIWFDDTGIKLSEPLTYLRGVLTGIPVEVETRDHEREHQAKPADGQR